MEKAPLPQLIGKGRLSASDRGGSSELFRFSFVLTILCLNISSC
jgi:hypothetical protein